MAFDRRPVTNVEPGPDNYVVQDGDNGISYLAQRFGVSTDDIIRDNPWLALNPDRVAVGQVINVPGLGVQRDLEAQTGSLGEAVVGGTASDTTGTVPTANTPPASPSPRLDENGMPLPEIRDGAVYDPNTDPVYRTLLDAIREAQASDQSIPADAVQVAENAYGPSMARVPRLDPLADAGTTMRDAGQGYGPADPGAPLVDGIAPPPEAPPILGPNFGAATADPLAAPNYSFTTPPAEQPWYSGENATTNSYAQGLNSAIAFVQALQQGNEFSAAFSGISLVNHLDRAAGGTGNVISQRWATGLGTVSSGLNLYDALKQGDEWGAAIAATNLASQIGGLTAIAEYGSLAAAAQAGSSAAALSTTLGQAAGALSIAYSLKQGDELGAAIGVVMMFNPVLGAALAVARLLLTDKTPPIVHGEAEVIWTDTGSLDIRVTQNERDGGESAQGMMQSMLDTLNGYLGQQVDRHGDPQFALIPQRLPTVAFHHQYDSRFILRYHDDQGRPVERYYDGQGQRLGLDGSVESTFAEDFLDEVLSQNAVVPKWEADTVRARINHGDPDAWKDETLPTPDDVKGGLMALTFHIPGAPSPQPSPGGRGENDADALRARFDLNGDGYLDPVDWTQPYQAFLALDRDGNGIIDSGRELLTTHASASHRTASLDWLDANNDGILNTDDPAFGALRLWLDVNSNAHTDDGELASLSQLGITAIDFTQSPPVIVDGEGNTQALTPKHLVPKGEGARIANDTTGTQIELQDGYRAFYLRAGDTRIQSAAPSPSVQEELARHTSNMSREAQGLFGGNAALLTGLAVAQTAAAGQIPLAA